MPAWQSCCHGPLGCLNTPARGGFDCVVCQLCMVCLTAAFLCLLAIMQALQAAGVDVAVLKPKVDAARVRSYMWMDLELKLEACIALVAKQLLAA